MNICSFSFCCILVIAIIIAIIAITKWLFITSNMVSTYFDTVNSLKNSSFVHYDTWFSYCGESKSTPVVRLLLSYFYCSSIFNFEGREWETFLIYLFHAT